TVDFMLAVLLLLGSTVGAQIGTAMGKKLKGDQLKVMLAMIVMAVTIKIIFELTLTPDLLLSQMGGH
ncbi:MAG TPA: sulfite exporter TauE/SafE family protein, partial [Nitrospirota bacterium]